MKLDTLNQIPVGDLHVREREARKTLDAESLRELSNSIKQCGVQEPLIVRETVGEGIEEKDSQQYEIVCGQRRLAAAIIARLNTVPCLVRRMTDAEAGQRPGHPDAGIVNFPYPSSAAGAILAAHGGMYAKSDFNFGGCFARFYRWFLRRAAVEV